MPRQPKKSPEAWNSEKPHIYKYYITDNESLPKTMELMKTNHNFDATKREYIRRLELWQFSKNIKKTEWQLVHARKLAHKETEIWLSGQCIDHKKWKRGMARYKIEAESSLQSTVSNSLLTRGIILRTPSPEPRIVVYTSTIPWFQFQDAFNCHLLSIIHEFIPTLNWDNLSTSPLTYYSSAELSMQNAKSLLGSIISLPDNHPEFAPLLMGRLEQILPWKSDSDYRLASNEPFFLLVQCCIYLCSNDSMKFNEINSFLSWMLNSGMLPLFSKFLQQQSQAHNPTMEIFLIRLLISAIWLKEEDLVSSLLIFGVDPNCNNSPRIVRYHIGRFHYAKFSLFLDGKVTPLQMAVLHENLNICRLLLRHGGSPNAFSSLLPISPLELAISAKHGNFEIAQILVESGADIHVSCHFELIQKSLKAIETDGYSLLAQETPQKTLLMKAIEVQNIDIARMLLAGGASPNDISFNPHSGLHLAVSKNDIEMVQLLIQKGAQINMFDTLENSTKDYFMHLLEDFRDMRKTKVFTYKQSEDDILRQFSAMSWYPFLTPIQIATRKNNPQVVQCLLHAGATVNHYLSHQHIWNQISIPDSQMDELHIYQHLVSNSRQRFQTIIHESVANGNIELTELLLQHGANALINYPNGLGTTPLQLACGLTEEGIAQACRDTGLEVSQIRTRLARLLISFNANVNAHPSSNDGRTALQAAAERGDQELVQLLIDNGAHIDAAPTIEDGVTAIEAAAMSGNPNLIETLFNHGAKVSPNIYWIGLYAAALNGDLESVKGFLKKDVHINALYSERSLSCVGGTILQAAVKGGHVKVVQAILDAGANVNQVAQGENILCTAARDNHIDLLDLMLRHGADPNSPDTHITPLAIAAEGGNLGMTKRLLQVVSDVNQLSGMVGDYMGNHSHLAPPLYWALKRLMEVEEIYEHDQQLKTQQLNTQQEICSLLLSHGADPNTRDVLSMSCNSMSDSFVETLIERGANVNIPLLDINKDSFSCLYPIQIATDRARKGVVRLLLSAGADPNTPLSQEGRCTLDMVFSFIHQMNSEKRETARLLIDAGAHCYDKPSILGRAIYSGFNDLAHDLIKNGADVNYLDTNPTHGMRPLHAAAFGGDISTVKLLLEHGAHVNTPSLEERTALQMAAKQGNFNICKLLIEKGARINAPAPRQSIFTPQATAPAPRQSIFALQATALQYAAYYGYLDICHLLLENDDDVDMIESRCKEAALYAEEKGHNVLARILNNYNPRAERVG